jgi:hypothetical protein
VKNIFLIIYMLTLCFSTESLASENDDYNRLNTFIAKIETAIPKNWKIVERKIGQIPEWHYDGIKYDGPRGVYLLMVGDQHVDYKWRDQANTWHNKIQFFKEAIGLWIMPAEYHESWKRFFTFKGHATTPAIYLGKDVKVYGQEVIYPNFQSLDLKKVFPNVSFFGGAPEHSVRSWINWKNDINTALNGRR